MPNLTFTVVECLEGWFVVNHDRMGPFISKARAMDLAEGMVAAIRQTGQQARVVVAEKIA